MNRYKSKEKEETCSRDIKEREAYIEGTDGLLKDFFKDIKKRQEEARNSKIRMPNFIKNVSDLEKMIKLHLFLLGESTDEDAHVTRGRDEELEKAIENDPEVRELFAELYRRTHKRH